MPAKDTGLDWFVNFTFYLCRRLAFTSDPNWPAVTFSGSLPQLMVHIDERKVMK